jgi:hypothetical protein
VGRFEIVKHEVDRVCRGADEDNLENGVVERLGVVEGPEQVDISGEVNNQVQELRLERNAGCALEACQNAPSRIGVSGQRTLDVFILCRRIKMENKWDKSPRSC